MLWFLNLLIKQFFTILKKLDQFFIFIFQLLDFLDISSLFVQVLVYNLLLLEQFRVDHVHILGTSSATVREEAILTSWWIGWSSWRSTNSVFIYINLIRILSILIFLCRRSAVWRSVWPNASSCSSNLFSLIIISRLIQILIWCSWLRSFPGIRTVSNPSSSHTEHCATARISDPTS